MENQREKNKGFLQSNFFSKNRKAQGMSTSTIILLILGLVILVILIIGFTMGWEKFGLFLPKDNIDNIKTSCEVACSTNSQYAFCSVERDVKDGVNDEFKATCYELVENPEFSSRGYGLSECPQIDCTA